jgi:hypothetical protein
MPPAYVKPYVKRHKNDATDAEAICEAVTRPNMRFVPTKTEEQQSCLTLHRTRHLFIRQQTSVINAICAHPHSRLGATLAGGPYGSFAHRSTILADFVTDTIRRKGLFGLRRSSCHMVVASQKGDTLAWLRRRLCRSLKPKFSSTKQKRYSARPACNGLRHSKSSNYASSRLPSALKLRLQLQHRLNGLQ